MTTQDLKEAMLTPNYIKKAISKAARQKEAEKLAIIKANTRFLEVSKKAIVQICPKSIFAIVNRERVEEFFCGKNKIATIKKIMNQKNEYKCPHIISLYIEKIGIVLFYYDDEIKLESDLLNLI